MTADLRDLYQEVILDHHRNPRNFGVMPQPDRTTNGHNPLCGDKVTVYLKLADGAVGDVRFEGVGCAICMASASIMTEQVRGKSRDEIGRLFKSFHTLLTESGDELQGRHLPSVGHVDGAANGLGKLKVFSGVRQYPIRVKCATLPWHTLWAAIEGKGQTVSTE